jgi:hypothetical protein
MSCGRGSRESGRVISACTLGSVTAVQCMRLVVLLLLGVRTVARMGSPSASGTGG